MIQHQELISSGRWEGMPFREQMANIGSEVSRAIRWKGNGRADRMIATLDRCLELTDFTIASQYGMRRRELLCSREILCDFLLEDNVYESTGEQIQRYYEAFAL